MRNSYDAADVSCLMDNTIILESDWAFSLSAC